MSEQGSGVTANRGGGLIGIVARNHVAANLLMVFFILGGFVTLFGMRAELFPPFDPGTITVSVPYPGATPAEVEDGVTRRVEEAVLGIEGVDRVVSTAFENRGVITIELKDFADPQEIKDDVQTAVDGIADFPPRDAEEPSVVVTEPVEPVATLVIKGDTDEATLRGIGAQLEREMLSLPQVSTVALRGVRPYEIAIEVEEEALRRYGLSLAAIAQIVNRSSLQVSAGVLRSEGGEILLRTDSEAKTKQAFEEIVVVTRPDGTLVRLKDIATVRDGFADGKVVSTYNGEQAIFLDVNRAGDDDILAIRESIDVFLADYTPPPGIEIQVFRDRTVILQDRLSLLTRNAILGFVLVFTLLVLTLDLRLAFWVAMGIPISFLGGFVVAGTADLSLNMVTLFGLIIVIGIVVDDAIVVGENIYSTQETQAPGRRGAILGAMNILPPVLVGVLTTMAAFAPLLFTGGDFGQITRSIPIVVIAVLFVSLIEAFLILPAHLSHGGRWSAGPLLAIQSRVAGFIAFCGDRFVIPLAEFSARYRYAMLAGAVAVLFIAYGLVAGGIVRSIFFPDIEGSEIAANLTMPDGTPYSTTEAAAKRILAAAEAVRTRIDEETGGEISIFQSIAVTIGGRATIGGGPGGSAGFTNASNLAQVQIELAPPGARTLSTGDVSRMWREELGEIAGAEQLTFNASIGPQSDDISYELAHEDEARLVDGVERLRRELARIEGVNEIDDTYDLGKRELNFELTEAGYAAGLSPEDLARTIRRAYFGEEVQRIQRGRDEVLVYVRYPDETRRSLESLADLRVRLPDGGEAPLLTVAEVSERRSLASIQRVDGRRVVTVTGDVDEDVTTPNDVNGEITDRILPGLVERIPGLVWSQEGAARDQQEDFASLLQGLAFALLIIFAMLATVLRSYLQPLIILASIPLGISGAIFGHLVMGYALSFVSFFGIVALSGVVVNSSVVLVDRYNTLRRDGNSVHDAIVQATRARFRPILLTTLSTSLGLLPIITETSTQAQFLIPMAVSLAFGLLFSGVMMLAVLPALTTAVEDLRRLVGVKDEAKPALGPAE